MGAGAETEEMDEGVKRLSPEEQQAHRMVLAEPVPANASPDALEKHFNNKRLSAWKLSDRAAQEEVLRAAVAALPNIPYFRNDLASSLISKGDIAGGNALYLPPPNPANAAYFYARRVCDLVGQQSDDAAKAASADVLGRIKTVQANARSDLDRYWAFRAGTVNAGCMRWLEDRAGNRDKAIAFAEEAERDARLALAGYVSSPRRDASLLEFAQSDVAWAVGNKLDMYTWAGRLAEAEATLGEFVRFAREVQLPPDSISRIFGKASDLRFRQREFVQAEALMRRAMVEWNKLDRSPKNAGNTDRIRRLALTLVGQNKWREALNEFEKLDALAGDDAKLQAQVRYAFERAGVYFGNGRFAEAASLFERSAKYNRERWGEKHFYTAVSAGMQGASLWRSATAENRQLALPLLKASVQAYMAPENAERQENLGNIYKWRDIVFAAYLDAMASTPGEDATQAMGAADWVRSGVVQQALGDAAARSAASSPALAEVVRQEQDAKNEVAALRRYLSGDAGSAETPLPQVATKMRERIAVLENQRTKLQAEIKAKFPEYERLVRPQPPSVQEIAAQLEPSQALLMLLPTQHAVYVWAVASDRTAGFARVDMDEERLIGLVASLRAQLDFGASSQAGTAFNSAAAFALYDQLLAPLASVFKGKTQLVVAAGGRLSQIPFGILQTRAGGGVGKDSPWLIKEASIAQVPSLTAWLAIKKLAKAPSASQSFAGWGDPAFNFAAAAATQPKSVKARSVVLSRAATLTQLDAAELAAPAPSALKYSDIPALPETRDELLAIANTLQASAETDLRLGAQATRESVLQASKSGYLSNRRVVAFATHGLVAGDLPNLDQPALALAATGKEVSNPLAPLLTLEDVLTLKLNADWVVLSACNTAAADGKAEEALSGLARGFFYAGSRSLLVTHWAVESESAKMLTTQTFAHYASHTDAPKAESLRQAMLQVMENPRYAHPAYWAPFALVGDGGR
jgi:CHAT domain-containing protein